MLALAAVNPGSTLLDVPHTQVMCRTCKWSAAHTSEVPDSNAICTACDLTGIFCGPVVWQGFNCNAAGWFYGWFPGRIPAPPSWMDFYNTVHHYYCVWMILSVTCSITCFVPCSITFFISYSTLYEAVPCSILGMAWGYQREPGGKVDLVVCVLFGLKIRILLHPALQTQANCERCLLNVRIDWILK